MKVGYIRVSSEQQSEARQREALAPYNLDKIFFEKISAKNMERPEFQKMMEFVREGDELYVVDLSRLSRSTTDLLQTLDILKEKHVELISLKEQINTNSAMGQALLKIVAVLNELERTNMLERQREGIEIAKREHKYKGRQPRRFDEAVYKSCLDDIAHRRLSISAGAKLLGVTRPTMYNILKREGIQYVG